MLSNSSFPQFLLILVGMIIFLSLIFGIFSSASDKIEKINDGQKLKNVKVFKRDSQTKSIQDLFRNAEGSPGEISRVLSKNYYSLFFDNKSKTFENLYSLLEHRNNILTVMNMGMANNLLEELSRKYYFNVSGAIFALCVYENSFNENKYFNESNINSIYRIVQEEHNKIAPKSCAENTIFMEYIYKDVVHIFKMNGVIISTRS